MEDNSLPNYTQKFINSFREYKLLYFILMFSFLFSLLIIYVFSSGQPVIELEHPTENIQVSTDQVYIKGKIKPKNSQVTVNDAQVYLNGDGTFTYVLPIKVGTNTIKVKAKKYSYKSEVVRLVERQEAKTETNKEINDGFSNQTKSQSQVSGFKVSDGTQGVVVTKQQILPFASPAKILGELSNQTGQEISDVKVTTLFYNPSNEVVDIKSSFITSPNLKLGVGQAIPFEIQSFLQPTDFSTYKFEVAWQ